MKALSTTSTTREFRAWAEAGFRSANPDAVGAVIKWVRSWKGAFPTGFKGFTGSFEVECPGFRPRTMNASWVEGEGGMVR